MKYGLFDNQLKTIEKILSSHPEIEEAVLFGSRAIDTFKEASDVDIALKGKKVTHKLAIELQSYFEEETDLPYFFDFASYSHIDNKNLIKHLDKEGIVIYRKGWQTVKLGNIVKSNQQNIDKNYPYTVIQYLDTGSITKGRIENLQVLDLKKAPSRAKRITKDKDIIYSNVRPIQRHYGFIRNPKENFIVSTGFSVIEVNQLKAHPFFIYNILTSDNIVQRLHKVAEGSVTTYPSLKPSDIENLTILLPPLAEQKAIAEVLSSLDDKIELLHKQNKTLEDMAQTLFHKYFIQNPNPTWPKKPLDEIADYLNGLACQKYPPKNDSDKLPVLKIKELKSGFTENSDWSSSEVEDKYIVELGDIIFSWSGSLLTKIWDGKKCILNQHLFKVTSKHYPKWFYYFWTKYYMQKFINIAESKATTMGHIKRKDLSNAMALVPSKDELSKMNKLMNPQFKKMISNFISISTLKKLRNTLLPKLISGQIRVTH